MPELNKQQFGALASVPPRKPDFDRVNRTVAAYVGASHSVAAQKALATPKN